MIDFATRRVVAKWHVPGGGSPDMMQLNPAGTELWASGRYNSTVYVFSTVSGQLIARIPVGSQDHGLTYFPNVGLHSIGHNGLSKTTGGPLLQRGPQRSAIPLHCSPAGANAGLRGSHAGRRSIT